MWGCGVRVLTKQTERGRRGQMRPRDNVEFGLGLGEARMGRGEEAEEGQHRFFK